MSTNFNVTSFIHQYAKLDNDTTVIDSQREYDSIFVHANELYDNNKFSENEKENNKIMNQIMKILKEAAKNIKDFIDPKNKSNIKANTIKIDSFSENDKKVTETYDENGNKTVEEEQVQRNKYGDVENTVYTTSEYVGDRMVKQTKKDDYGIKEETFTETPGESTVVIKDLEGNIEYESHKFDKEGCSFDETKYPDGRQCLDVTGTAGEDDRSTGILMDFDKDGNITRVVSSYIKNGENHISFTTVSNENGKMTLHAYGQINGESLGGVECKTKADVDELLRRLTNSGNS